MTTLKSSYCAFLATSASTSRRLWQAGNFSSLLPGTKLCQGQHNTSPGRSSAVRSQHSLHIPPAQAALLPRETQLTGDHMLAAGCRVRRCFATSRSPLQITPVPFPPQAPSLLAISALSYYLRGMLAALVVFQSSRLEITISKCKERYLRP